MAAKFSQQNYEVLADILNDARTRLDDPGQQTAVKEIVRTLSAYLADDNGSFDAVRFKRACGLEIDGSEPSNNPASQTDDLDSSNPYYNGPGLDSIPLGNGFEVLLTESRLGSRPASLRLRREESPSFCWWIADIGPDGLYLHSGLTTGISLEKGLGYVAVRRI